MPCTEFIKERVYTAETLEEIDTAGTHTKQHYTICLDQPQPTTSTTLRNVDLLMSPDTKKSNQTSKQALPQSRASSAILPKKIAKRKYNCYHKISDNREQLYPCISKDNFWFNQQSSKILDMVFYYSKFCIPGEKHVLHVRCNHVTINCRKSVLRMTE